MQASLVVVAAAKGQDMSLHAIKVSEYPLDGIPVCPSRILHELGEEGYGEGDVWACAQCCIHEQPDCFTI